MSVPIVRSLDRLLATKEQMKFGTNSGAESVTKRVYVANSVSESSITWSNITLPSIGNVTDRRFFVELEFYLKARGITPVNVPLFQIGTNDAPRWNGLLQGISNINLSLNGNSITEPLGDYIEPLFRYHPKVDSEGMFSSAPNFQDFYQEYSDYLANGSAKNALGKFENGYETLRGAFGGISVEALDNPIGDGVTEQDGKVKVRMMSPITISPLTWSEHAQKGLTDIQTINLVINFFPGLVSRMWSRAVDVSTDFVSSSISFTDPSLIKPTLNLSIYQPKLMDRPGPINEYAYEHVERYFSQSGVLAGGAELSLQANNIQMGAVPERIYVFCKRSDDTRTVGTTDTYLNINSLSVDFDSKSGLLASASEHDLYEMSRQNGLNMSWSQWTKYTGSVLCIDFAKDISLNSGTMTSELGSFQFACKVGVKNLGVNPFGYTLVVVPVFGGIMKVQDQQVSLTQGIVTPEQADKIHIYNTIVSPQEFEGGSFGKRITHFAKQALKKGKELADSEIGQKAISLGKAAAKDIGSDVLKALAPRVKALVGLGYSVDEATYIANGMMGSGLFPASSGKSVGGKLASKKKMQKSLYDRL